VKGEREVRGKIDQRIWEDREIAQCKARESTDRAAEGAEAGMAG
jgi:hypothetical protein